MKERNATMKNNTTGLAGIKSSRGSSQSINVMKSDTYNIVLTLVAFIVIIFSIGASFYTIQKCESMIEKQTQDIKELNNKYDVLKEIFISGK